MLKPLTNILLFFKRSQVETEEIGRDHKPNTVTPVLLVQTWSAPHSFSILSPPTMTHHSRSVASSALPLSPSVAAYPAPFMMAVMLVPFPFMGMGGFFTLPSAMPPAAPSSAPSVAPVPESAPAKSSPAAPPAAAPTAPAAPAPRNPGAGLPAPLVALLRDEAGPFLANEVFSVTPPEPLTAIEEEVAAPEWYAITRGRFVGVVDQFALSAVAISGVAHGARKSYTTQGLALDAFNRALEWGGVQVA
ncbi:hypothetical protein C8R47DRAFT_1211101 [Mycena vitilis]|nr:hypothetical protein C8R47DRAFT_1211101 [Mycena vitilis]